jgi:C-type lectin domain family 4 member M
MKQIVLSLLFIAFATGFCEEQSLESYEIPNRYPKQTLDMSGIGCPPDWILFDNNCYLISSEVGDYVDSIEFCESFGAQRVIVQSSEENSFLETILPVGGRGFLLGLLKKPGQDIYYWDDDTPLTYSNWINHFQECEPDEHWPCVGVMRNGVNSSERTAWDQMKAHTDVHRFMCETPNIEENGFSEKELVKFPLYYKTTHPDPVCMSSCTMKCKERCIFNKEKVLL